MMSSQELFDFGTGPVPAHRHSNGGGWVADSASVSATAFVDENASVSGNAQVFDYARVYDSASVFDNASVIGNARVFGDASVFDNARVYDSASVFGDARVFGNARVYGYARVYNDHFVKFSNTTSDLEENINESLRVQCDLFFVNNEDYCYKRVNGDLTSEYDDSFKYVVGEWAEVKNPDMSKKSCSNGLHFSRATYYDILEDCVHLLCRVRREDIITIQSGKIRAKKAFVIGVVDQ